MAEGDGDVDGDDKQRAEAVPNEIPNNYDMATELVPKEIENDHRATRQSTTDICLSRRRSNELLKEGDSRARSIKSYRQVEAHQ